MATKTLSRPAQQAMINGDSRPEDRTIDDFFALLSKLTSDKGYQMLTGLVKKNDSLTKEVDDRTITNTKNFEAIRKLMEDKEEQEQQLKQSSANEMALKKQLGQVKDANAQKTTELESTSAAVTKLMKQMKEKDAEILKLSESKAALAKLQTRLQAKDKELKTQSEQVENLQESLALFESYTTSMKKVHAFKADVTPSLSSLFTKAYGLMERFLFQDLPQDSLASRTMRESLKPYKFHDRSNTIPLPISNTLPAKQMRLAIGLAILGGALRRHLFQPVYNSTDANDLSASLNELAEENPDFESHARGVLLNVMDGDIQEAHGLQRAGKAYTEVLNTIAKVIPEADKAFFETELRALCNQALACWFPIQRVTERIIAEVEYTEEVDEWSRLPLPTRLPSQRGGAGDNPSDDVNASGTASSPPNGSSSQAGPGRQGAAIATTSGPADQAQSPTKLVPLEPKPKEPVYEVWPSFVANDEDATVLHHGFALTEEQVKEAKAQAEKEDTPRRVDRERSRRGSTTNGLARRERRNSVAPSFLNARNGGASSAG